MSASRLVTIFCDECSHWVDRGVAQTATDARRQLRGTGWLTGVPNATATRAALVGVGSLDYCPKHAKDVVR